MKKFYQTEWQNIPFSSVCSFDKDACQMVAGAVWALHKRTVLRVDAHEGRLPRYYERSWFFFSDGWVYRNTSSAYLLDYGQWNA